MLSEEEIIQLYNIKTLLTNSGLTVCKSSDTTTIKFVDPACILPAFDSFIGYAWTVICLLTVFIIFGWAVLYIRNGVRLDSIFKNIKSLLLILITLSVVIPAIDYIYGNGALFEKRIEQDCGKYTFCKIKEIPTERIKKLYEERKVKLQRNEQAFLYENLEVIVENKPEEDGYF